MAYKVIILYQLYMPSYFLGTFTEYPLLNYAYGKGLLCDNPCDNEGNLIMPSIIKESSLTEIGKHIFVELLFKWFAYTDNESGKIDRKNNIKMLEKYYNQLLQKIDRK